MSRTYIKGVRKSGIHWPWNRHGLLTGRGRWKLARSAGWSLANCLRAFFNYPPTETVIEGLDHPTGPEGA